MTDYYGWFDGGIPFDMMEAATPNRPPHGREVCRDCLTVIWKCDCTAKHGAVIFGSCEKHAKK